MPIWRQDVHVRGGPAQRVRLRRRHQPSGRRRERHSRHQPARGAAQGGRVRPGLRGRDLHRGPRPAAGGAGPQRHLRGLPQAAHAHGRLPPVPASERQGPPAEEEWLAAKIVGRWPSGAPLALAPDKDDPELGADPQRNNAFMFGDDPQGLKCPVGSHVRRMNPRDAVVIGAAAPAPHDPARHHLRPAAAPRRHGGRRRRPRPHVRLRRGAPGPAVRVRPDGVGQRRQVHRLTRREGPAGRQQRRPEVHHPEAADPPPPQGTARLRRQSRRRVLLHARPEGAALARRSRHLSWAPAEGHLI